VSPAAWRSSCNCGRRGSLSAAEKQAAIESQLQTIAGTRLELATSGRCRDKARVAILTDELRIRIAILDVMRTETLTQAELNALTITEEAALGAAGATGKAATEGIAAGLSLPGKLTRATSGSSGLARELETAAMSLALSARSSVPLAGKERSGSDAFGCSFPVARPRREQLPR